MALSTKAVAGDDSVHYVPPRKKRQLAKPKMQPPLTPMIDVTFQLLLFFILTLTFRQAEGLIPGSLPGNQGSSSRAPIPPIVIDVVVPLDIANDDAGAFFIESDRFENAQLLFEELQRQSRELQTAKRPIVINPAPGVRWQHVVDAFNGGVRAKYEKVGFARGSPRG